MLNIGPQELIVVLIIALLVVGPSRLPELGRSIGKALREFRKVQDEVKDTFRFDQNEDPSAPSTTSGQRPHAARTGTANGGGPQGAGPIDVEPGAPSPAPTEPGAPSPAPTEPAGADTPTDGPAPDPSA